MGQRRRNSNNYAYSICAYYSYTCAKPSQRHKRRKKIKIGNYKHHIAGSNFKNNPICNLLTRKVWTFKKKPKHVSHWGTKSRPYQKTADLLATLMFIIFARLLVWWFSAKILVFNYLQLIYTSRHKSINRCSLRLLIFYSSQISV
jgi:hypothetical protein